MSEIKPIFDPEAIKQLADVNKYLDEIKMSVTNLQKSKVNIGSFKEANEEGKKTKIVLTDIEKAQKKLSDAQIKSGAELVKIRT